MPCCCRQWRGCSENRSRLVLDRGLSHATQFRGLGDFLQKRKRVTIRDKNGRQVFLLLGDNRGFCYETFGALVEAFLLIDGGGTHQCA